MLTEEQCAEIFVTWCKGFNKRGMKFNPIKINRDKLLALIQRDFGNEGFENINSYTVAWAALDSAGEFEPPPPDIEGAKTILAAEAEKVRQRNLALERKDRGSEGFWTDDDGRVHKRHLTEEEVETQQKQAAQEAQTQYRATIQGVWKELLNKCETETEWNTVLRNIRTQVANAAHPEVETPIAEKWIRENASQFTPPLRLNITDYTDQLKAILDVGTVDQATPEIKKSITRWVQVTPSETFRIIRKSNPDMAKKMDLILVKNWDGSL
jgi:hypothetical protein